MSEKQQRTVASTREKMAHRYADGLSHKHNKCHHAYRRHQRTYPVQTNDITEQLEGATGLVREFKLRKMRKRLDKGRFH